MATPGGPQQGGAFVFDGPVFDVSALIRAMGGGHRRVVVAQGTTVALPAQNMARQRGVTIETQGAAPAAGAPPSAAVSSPVPQPGVRYGENAVPPGVRLGTHGPILPAPAAERKPAGYATEAFRTPGTAPNLLSSTRGAGQAPTRPTAVEGPFMGPSAAAPRPAESAPSPAPQPGIRYGENAVPPGVRLGPHGPILPAPAEERKPDGYAQAAFRTPGSAPNLLRQSRPGVPQENQPPPDDTPFVGPASGLTAAPARPAPAPSGGSSVIGRGSSGGSEWGSAVTADQELPATQYRTNLAPQRPPQGPENSGGVSVIGRRGGGEWGAPVGADESLPPTPFRAPGGGTAVAEPVTQAYAAPVAKAVHSASTAVGAPTANGAAALAKDLDPITVDLIENALRSVRYEMDAVLFRTAMSPAIREQHDEFPLVATPGGKMVVGQFGSFIAGFLQNYKGTINEGDVFFTNDPYSVDGAVSHLNDWLVLLPIYHDHRLVGWASMFGHMSDIGGAVPGSMPIGARTIHEEGVIVKPFKVFDQGRLDEDRLDLILTQCRLPDWNRSDLFGIIAACRIAEKRVRELCDRFGSDTYLGVLDALLDRNYRAMRQLIHNNIPETPQSFEDYVDDDGQGFGPYKLKCTVWREGDKAIFDWTGTDPQSPAAISFLFNTEMHKMFVGTYMIMLYDPQILFNDGFYDLIEVRIPRGSLLKPVYPTALNGRTHTLGRVFDVFGAALGKHAPQFLNAAGFSTSPHLFYSGYDQSGEWYQLFQISFGGVPGRPIGDGMDGHSLWPEFNNIPNEYLESYFPLVIERYEVVEDSGGAGLHRGGNGVDQVYRFTADGEISIHDDRWLTYPWGVIGGKPGQRGMKILIRPDGTQENLPAKADHIKVVAGDVLHYITWGGGGWGDPLERAADLVRLDVLRGFVSEQKAFDDYGVVVLDGGEGVDAAATESRRAQMRATRGPVKDFDFGPSIEEILANCEAETGLKPPMKPVFRQIAG